MAAGALLLATALAGAAARGVGRSPGPTPAKGTATFAAPPTGRVSFTGTLDRTAVLAGRNGIVRMELALRAAPTDPERAVRRPTDVVIILDRSGSMNGEKITHARAAVRELLAQLSAQDRFALVAYSDDAAVVAPLAPVDERLRTGLLAAVADIRPDGGTNMSSGLDLGLDVIERGRAEGRVPHAILISDGLANQGDASPEGLLRRARRAAQGEYMLSSVGVGEDFNEYLMTALADAGTGNYYYLRDASELAGVFAREFDAARTTVAAGLAVDIAPGAGVHVIDAAGYPLEPTDDGVRFHPGSLFAGQERRIWVTLALPAHPIGEYELGRFALSYGDPNERTTIRFTDVPHIASVQNDDEFYAHVDTGTWGRSVVSDLYNKMQDEVAREVAAGHRDQALQRLRGFKDETAAMNAHLHSAPVVEELRSADALEAQVSGAFEGADQVQRRNELSKSMSARAVEGRRAGAKP
jgi:Ca-activated chloride channel family protein